MSKFAQYFALEKQLKATGYKADRSDLIADYTGNRSTSLKELTPHEYNGLIRFMNEQLQPFKQKQEDKNRRQRRKVIALFCNMHYVTADGKADMKRINDWCIKYGHLHVELTYYSGADLTRLVSQAENTYKTFIQTR